MRTVLFVIGVLFFTNGINAQTVYFESDVDVINYMDGKVFYDSNSGLNVEYGYISSYNTYGIKVTNKNDAIFYFINVGIDTYGSSADLFGMSPTTGDNFGFRLFRGKLVVGYDEPEEATFYLKE
jgi:hypothetical protein